MCRGPGVQKWSHDVQKALELITPNVMACACDMGNAQLRDRFLHLGSPFGGHTRALLRIGGDQQCRAGNLGEHDLPVDRGGVSTTKDVEAEAQLGLGLWAELRIRPVWGLCALGGDHLLRRLPLDGLNPAMDPCEPVIAA